MCTSQDRENYIQGFGRSTQQTVKVNLVKIENHLKIGLLVTEDVMLTTELSDMRSGERKVLTNSTNSAVSNTRLSNKEKGGNLHSRLSFDLLHGTQGCVHSYTLTCTCTDTHTRL